jgi:hypothetical protein
LDANGAAVSLPSGPYPVLSYADLKAGGPPERSWLWHGYLVPGGVTLLTSQWKAGKSTLISVLLARMRTGGLLAGRPLAAGRAVVVSEEDPSLWRDRGQVLGFGDHLHWICRPFLARPREDEWLALLDQVGRLHERARVDLLVLDALANLAPLRSENDAAEMLKALLPLQRLTSRGLCALIAHHPKKGVIVPGQAARGSGALPAFVDVVVEMQPVARRNPRDRRRRLRAYSRHEATPPSWVIEWTADGTDYVGLGPSAEPDFEQGWPLLQGVLAGAERSLTRREIHRRWPDAGAVPVPQTLWKWLDRLVKEDRVLRDGQGSRTDPYRYRLPGMVEKWQANFMEAFLKQLETDTGPAGPGPGS